MSRMMSTASCRLTSGGLGTRIMLCRPAPQQHHCSRRPLSVRASKVESEEEQKKKVLAIEESLQQSGLDRSKAQVVLQAWQELAGGDGKEVTAEDLRKVLVKQGSKMSGLVVVQVLLDVGAAYGAFTAGIFLGEAATQYGVPAIVLQAFAFILSGYYASGAVFDLFKLGVLLIATYQFNVDSAAFLLAVKDLAGSSPSGLGTVDKAVEAANTLKVMAALRKMADLLQEKAQEKQQGGGGDSNGMLQDLAAYLTLEKAQRVFGFDASKYGLTDAQATKIASVFSAFDADDNGLLSLDEFQRLCAKYAPELSATEVKAALSVLDTNKDGSVSLGEFVEWWVSLKQVAA